MNKNFLTDQQVIDKLGSADISSTPNNFCTKSRAIKYGADSGHLASYLDSHFPIDNDIVFTDLPILFGPYTGTTSGDSVHVLPSTFNLVRPFKITGAIMFSSVSTQGRGITIYRSGASDDGSKFDITCWGNEIPLNINNNIKNSSNVWTGLLQEPYSLGETISFDIKYDGTTLKRTIGTAYQEEVVQLFNIECDKVCFTGSPWWYAGDCTATITDFIIRQ